MRKLLTLLLSITLVVTMTPAFALMGTDEAYANDDPQITWTEGKIAQLSKDGSEVGQYATVKDALAEHQSGEAGENECVVTFNVQGHGTAPAAQTVVKGGLCTKPDDPVCEGYIFKGWYEEAECINGWNFDNDTVTKDTELFAEWEKEPVKEVKTGFIAAGVSKGTYNLVKWTKVKNATCYDVYAAKCGKSFKKVKTTFGFKYLKKKLNAKGVYKYKVKAYRVEDDEKIFLESTPVIHVAGSKSKYSNALKVKASRKSVALDKGDAFKITAKVIKKSSKKPLLWNGHVKSVIRYMSSDKSVATVDSKGRIKAKGEGTSYIYAYAANGCYAKVKVKVAE